MLLVEMISPLLYKGSSKEILQAKLEEVLAGKTFRLHHPFDDDDPETGPFDFSFTIGAIEIECRGRTSELRLIRMRSLAARTFFMDGRRVIDVVFLPNGEGRQPTINLRVDDPWSDVRLYSISPKTEQETQSDATS